MVINDTYQTPECAVFECIAGSVICASGDPTPGGNEDIGYINW